MVGADASDTWMREYSGAVSSRPAQEGGSRPLPEVTSQTLGQVIFQVDEDDIVDEADH